jgi:hypothetical protein
LYFQLAYINNTTGFHIFEGGSSAEVSTQGFALVSQAFYNLSHTSSLFSSGYFED